MNEAARTEAALHSGTDATGGCSLGPTGLRRWPTWDLVEVGLALAAFAVLCVVILKTATFLPEPDDYAYRASIVAMTDGHFLTLSTAHVNALARQLRQGCAFRARPG